MIVNKTAARPQTAVIGGQRGLDILRMRSTRKVVQCRLRPAHRFTGRMNVGISGCAALKFENDDLTLFVTHRSALVDYAASILGCRARAEDIVQDAYLRFNTALERGRDTGTTVVHPVAYLYRIVRNLALNAERRQGTERVAVTESTPAQPADMSPPTPEQSAIYRDQLRTVEEALYELPERTSRAFELHRIRGYTLERVADTLGISVGLAHKLVRDALTHCAARLNNNN